MWLRAISNHGPACVMQGPWLHYISWAGWGPGQWEDTNQDRFQLLSPLLPGSQWAYLDQLFCWDKYIKWRLGALDLISCGHHHPPSLPPACTDLHPNLPLLPSYLLQLPVWSPQLLVWGLPSFILPGSKLPAIGTAHVMAASMKQWQIVKSTIVSWWYDWAIKLWIFSKYFLNICHLQGFSQYCEPFESSEYYIFCFLK